MQRNVPIFAACDLTVGKVACTDAGEKIPVPQYRARATEGVGQKDENLRREGVGEAGIPRLCLPTSLPKPHTTHVRCRLIATQLKTEDLD